MSELSTTPATGWQSTLDNLLRAGQAYLTLEQQRELQRINIERASQGLAPLDVSQYGMGVNVGVSNETSKLVKTALIFGLVGIVLNKLLK